MEIEDRIYGPDSSPAEIQMLCDRVQLYKEDILLFKELKIMSPFAIEVMTNEMARYLNNGQARFVIIDLVGVPPPNAVLRTKLKECYSKYTDQIEHMTFFTGMNSIQNLVAKYMMRTIGYKKYSFHRTREQAIKAIEDDKLKLKNT